MSRIDALDEIFAKPEVFGCRFTDRENRMLNAGDPGGWMVGRALVSSLYSGFADVSFSQMTAGALLVPTLDVFVDDTVGAALALASDKDGAFSGAGSAYRFLPAVNVHEGVKNLVYAAPHSMAAHLFTAGTAIVREVRGLLDAGFCKDEINWGFSSMPVILRESGDEASLELEARVKKCSQLVSVWLRGNDEELMRYLELRNGDGELRLHNLLTGNTFIGGAVDEAELAKCLK